MQSVASTQGGEVAGQGPVASGPARVEWVDHAKGICIFFVVMLHVTDVAQEWVHGTGWLEAVVTFARPFRMPDFFLIAGLFLASALRRPWRQYLDTKVVHFLYFYGLWMTLQFAVMDARHVLAADGGGASAVVLAYLHRWIEPHGALWFIHILPIFFVATRVLAGPLARVPPLLVWLGAAALHSLQIQSEYHVIYEGASRFVYFYSGYLLAPHIFRIAAWARARVPAAVAYLAVWGVANGLVVAAGWSQLPGVSLALGYAGALAVILAAVLLSLAAWAWPLQYLGENSLVVYLSDFWVCLIAVRGLALVVGDPGWLAATATQVTVLGTLAVWRLALPTPARFMYVRPHWASLIREPAKAGSEVGAGPAVLEPSTPEARGADRS